MSNFAPLLIHKNKIKEKSVEIWIKTKYSLINKTYI